MARIHLEIPPAFSFTTEIPIRIGDINYGGHLANDSVLSIIHDARLQFLKSLGFTELDIGGASLIMSDVAIVYKSEGFYGDVLTIGVVAQDFKRHGFDLFFQLKNKATDKEVARAKTGMVAFDYQTRKVCLVPKLFLERVGGLNGA